ncbi:unnamed protein product [Xylocopa violacea]|uniref:Tyrosinase copper-binding domain-containing protein n=1 Tax=Xylocopa violacea TaxID=135666 RepID=A0ABP1NL99_XYLVO
MSIDKSVILHLLARPSEPVYLPKGKKNVVFEIPHEYLTDRYRPLAEYLPRPPMLRGSTSVVRVKPLREVPDLSVVLRLERRQSFSLFVREHRDIAAHLINLFMKWDAFEDFLSAAVYAHDRVNIYLYVYALSVAIIHHPETKHLYLPPLHTILPEKFIPATIFPQAREITHVLPPGKRMTITIPKDYTASDLDMEHRVAYWREDIGINLHHWHWHLVYPFFGDMKIVNKDRRGELFYYMHHQMLARYNCERLSNQLERVVRFINWNEPIPEAYFSKLDSIVASRIWPARTAGAVLKDVHRPINKSKFDIQDLERWRDRIYEAIHRKSVIDKNGNVIPLTEKNGIDVLGNMVEASILSPNRHLYGNIHNTGHDALACVHDPDNRYLEDIGVMGDVATAARDPIFYRWHAFIDSVFQEYKDTLAPYPKDQLIYPGIRVTDIKVITDESNENVVYTFWEESDINLEHGLDFMATGKMNFKITHLNHSEFTYKIQIQNNQNQKHKGTVRIFMAPKYDERGYQFTFKEQKNLMVEMDKFSVDLDAGKNTIERKSTDSAVTIPFHQIFPDPDDVIPAECKDSNSTNFCGCGWPHYLLVPKGNNGGFHMDVFVMVSNFKDDVVPSQAPDEHVKDAASYCGLRDHKYPDARPMGYPFDRQPEQTVEYLTDFLTDNMNTADIQVVFRDSHFFKCK